MPYDFKDTPLGRKQFALNIACERMDEFSLSKRKLAVAIKRAHDAGCSMKEISERLKMAHGQVSQMLKDAR